MIDYVSIYRKMCQFFAKKGNTRAVETLSVLGTFSACALETLNSGGGLTDAQVEEEALAQHVDASTVRSVLAGFHTWLAREKSTLDEMAAEGPDALKRKIVIRRDGERGFWIRER